MKGLKEYIKKHGNHFTEQLALTVTDGRWDGVRVEKAAQRRVYYNVTGSTLGDMVYLVNKVHSDGLLVKDTIVQCVAFMLCVISSYDNGRDAAFSDWLEDLTDFDFTPYI